MKKRTTIPLVSAVLLLGLLASGSVRALLGEQLYLNLGLAEWVMAVASDQPQQKAYYWLEPVRDIGNDRLQWALGNLYWEDDAREKARAIWRLNEAAAQMIQVSTHFSQSGNEVQAIKWSKRAEELGACLVTVWYQRGSRAEARSNWDAALTAYENGLRNTISACDQIGYSDLFYRSGFIWQNKVAPSNKVKARDLYQQAANINDFRSMPFAIDNYYRLGQILFSLGAQHDHEAKIYLERALAMQPDHTWSNLVLGRIIFRQDGDFNQAYQHLIRALQADTSDNWLFPYYVGELFASAGCSYDARAYFQQALTRSPGNKRIEDKLATLASQLTMQVSPCLSVHDEIRETQSR